MGRLTPLCASPYKPPSALPTGLPGAAPSLFSQETPKKVNMSSNPHASPPPTAKGNASHPFLGLHMTLGDVPFPLQAPFLLGQARGSYSASPEQGTLPQQFLGAPCWHSDVQGWFPAQHSPLQAKAASVPQMPGGMDPLPATPFSSMPPPQPGRGSAGPRPLTEVPRTRS